MLKTSKLIFSVVLTMLVLLAVVNFASPATAKRQQQNHAPVVKIISPKNQSTFDLNTLIHYEITVADKEDGDSKYDELNTKEVLLEVHCFKDSAQALAQLGKQDAGDPPALASIRTSNCFNCHNFNSKSIGPSFADISKKYPFNPNNIALLVKHVKEGATGTWGKVSMPTHPELSAVQIQSMVTWILQNARDASVDYYIGTEGNFKLKPPIPPATKGVYVLTASYIDHGTKQDSTKHLKGTDVIVINNRP